GIRHRRSRAPSFDPSFGPFGKFLPENLRIMPDIHRKSRMEKDISDRGSVGISGTDLQKFLADKRLPGTAHPLFQLDTENRTLPARLTDSDNRGAEHFRMGIENPFHGDGVQGSRCRPHPMAFPATEPDPSFFIEVTQIPHPVPETAGRIRDLCQACSFRTAEIGCRDLRSTDRYLADLTVCYREVFRPDIDRLVSDPDNRQGKTFNRPSDT